MTTDELRRELDRIAEGAPAVDLPHDTWTRARRSAVRDRVVGGAAAVAVVAAVAGASTWLPDRAQPPVASSESGAVPSRIWTLPEDVTIKPDEGLAMGVVSAAYVTRDASDGDWNLVAVSAEDGSYHRLLLPDPGGADAIQRSSADTPVLALSPDGRRLAYAYSPAESAIPDGVAVADLTTGQVDFVPTGISKRFFLRQIVWSPGGTYLVIGGQVMPDRSSFGDTAAALVGPDDTSTPLPAEGGRPRGYAVEDDGRVALIDGERVRIWQDGRIVERRADAVFQTSSVSAHLAGDVVTDIRNPVPGDEEPGASQTVFFRHDGAKPSQMTSFPEEFKSSWEVLGWTRDSAAIVQAQVSDSDSVDDDLYRVDLNADGSLTTELIVELEPGSPPDALTIATDLPVEELATPEWANEPWWGLDPSLLIGLGVTAAIALLLAVRWRWQRRTAHVTLS